MIDDVASSRRPYRVATEPDTIDAYSSVLAVVELLRQLMERQALRRVEDGGLTAAEEERIGLALMLLEDRMARVCDRFELSPHDLNIDLGPLGTLLPT